MNKHIKFYKDMESKLVPKDIRVSKKELEYYIKGNVAWHYPKKFTITELKYFILETINAKDEQEKTISQLRQEILEYESMYDSMNYADGDSVYLSDGIYLTPDGGSYDDKD